MRKSPTFTKHNTCQRCSELYIPCGPRQFYCKTCSVIADKERKRKWYSKNNPNAYKKKKLKVCAICSGEFESHYEGVPYCKSHYQKAYSYGDPLYERPKSLNTYVTNGDTTTVYTTANVSFLIDTEDLPKILERTWCISKTGYAVAGISRKTVKLHRHLLNPSPKEVIDHINGDPLDNRRENLRICTNSENTKNNRLQKNNPLGYTGIRKTPHGMYNARITVDRQEIHIGNYPTFEEAVLARIDAEVKYYGEFSPSLGALRGLITTSVLGESPE